VLAQVVVSKFAEHVPLYRFEDNSTRYGLYLKRGESVVKAVLAPLFADLQPGSDSPGPR
jgi:hypothetical protein